MKFLCPNCKAKYQISDEKIAGRTLKMDCRRCNHAIVIRGESVAAKSDKRGSARPSSSHASAGRRRSGSHVGPAPAARSSRSALGADFRRNAGAAAPSSRPTALDQWHIAINDVPVGPMKREEVVKKIQSGAVTGASLCWREGFDDWRPLRDVPELAAMLRRAQPPKAPPKPAFPSPSRALGRSASPPRPARPPTGRTATAPSRSESARPAARGNVVPIGGRLGAAAAPALDELESFGGEDLLDDDEPTRVGAAVDFEQLAREEEAAAEQASAASAPTPSATPTPAPTGAASDADAFDPFASQRAPAPVPPASSPGAFEPPPAAASSPGAFGAAQGSAPGSFAAPEPAPAAASYAEPAPERRRGGLPIGAWIAIAGAIAFGVALAVMVGTHFLTQPTQPVATTQPTPADTTDETPREADLDLPEETPPEETPEDPVAETEGEGDEGEGGDDEGTASPRPGRNPRPSTGTRPAQQTQVDEETAARLRRFAEAGGGPAEIDVGNRNPLGEERRSGGSGSLTGEQIAAVVRREQSGVQRCWSTALRQVGRATSTRIDVDVTIGSSGTVMRANARGRGIANLTDCIESNVRRWRFPRSGGETRTSIPFVFQGTE